ncbi:UNKNOWN [Stylonychia lemnae]|uniref:Transmembrane protein n=1 Tax=Stylonychia lemnae TaxID=5949 RepID=A0A078AUC2_STYLE|nr:UNKNOWN [Stylonychia lemnae]|eukprot:CDW86000.1 UNKNOWN [Stylonychia lemnae]
MILPLSKHPDFELMGSQTGVYSKKFSTSQVVYKKSTSTGNPITEGRDLLERSSVNSDSNNFDLSSLSSTNSSTNSNAIQSHYAKNLLFQKKAPKILKISAVVLACTIVSFLIISIYNLAVFTDKHQQISGRLTAMSYISQRNANMRASILNIKTIQLIAQDLKNLNQSSVLPPNRSRIDYYLRNMITNLGIVRDQSDKLYTFISLNKQYFSFNLNFDNLTFLTDKGYMYKISVVFKQATKLLGSYSEALTIADFVNEKPSLNVTNYAKDYSKLRNDTFNRSLTQLEQSLFFIFENGMYQQQELGYRQLLMIQEASFEQTDSSQTTLMVTTFVSVGIVTLICIIIFPLLTKVLDRIYTVLKLYNSLDKAIIEKCYQQGVQFKKQLRTKISREKHKLKAELKVKEIQGKDDSLESPDNKIQSSEIDKISSRRYIKDTDSKRGLKENEDQITFSKKNSKRPKSKYQKNKNSLGTIKQNVITSLKADQIDEKYYGTRRMSVNIKKLEQIEEEKEDESQSDSKDISSPKNIRKNKKHGENSGSKAKRGGSHILTKDEIIKDLFVCLSHDMLPKQFFAYFILSKPNSIQI